MFDAVSSRELTDDVLQEEIALLGAMMLAASGMTVSLTQDEVDRVLGVAVT